MKAAVAEYMSKRESQKRIQTLIGKSASRLDVNLDDLRGFSPDLAKYIAKNPIDAINMFES
jgi:DNA replicative helicase MCM subunit Mcm2 (Cdc46/Mcm family)